ncbi:MAG: HIRAN domain-containing protein [Patescibacteria group bacterium]|nr:HIRAN domain-containing protein [Patescibacteria group bacterium]
MSLVMEVASTSSQTNPASGIPGLILIGGIIALVVWLRARSKNKSAAPTASAPPSITEVGAKYFPLSGSGNVEVKGESHYLDTLNWLAANIVDLDAITAALIPEPDNKYDKNAVRVDIFLNGRNYKVGYLAAEEARPYSKVLLPLFEENRYGTCRAKFWTAPGTIQVYLDLDVPKKILGTP